MTEQLDKVKAQLQEELNNVSSLQAKVSELEVCSLQDSNKVIHAYITRYLMLVERVQSPLRVHALREHSGL